MSPDFRSIRKHYTYPDLEMKGHIIIALKERKNRKKKTVILSNSNGIKFDYFIMMTNHVYLIPSSCITFSQLNQTSCNNSHLMFWAHELLGGKELPRDMYKV